MISNAPTKLQPFNHIYRRLYPVSPDNFQENGQISLQHHKADVMCRKLNLWSACYSFNFYNTDKVARFVSLAANKSETE